MRILGVTASSIVGFDPAYDLISTTVLQSNTGPVVFNNLGIYASTYKHLQVRMVTRSPHAGASILSMQLNGDTASNYSWHWLYGNGSSVQSGATSNASEILVRDIPSANETANAFGATVLDILDPYSTTKNKTTRALHGSAVSGAQFVTFSSGAWRNTASLTQISFSAYAGFVAGSRFSLYGIRG
jgi:hypothetical protein